MTAEPRLPSQIALGDIDPPGIAPTDDDGLAVFAEVLADGLVEVVAPCCEMVPLHPAITPRAIATATQANVFRMLFLVGLIY